MQKTSIATTANHTCLAGYDSSYCAENAQNCKHQCGTFADTTRARSDLLNEIATGSVIAYSPAHQIACCDSLTRIGFGNISLSKIEQYVASAKHWCEHISALTTDPDCQLFFPHGTITVDSIYGLARIHDQQNKPPVAAVGVQNLQLALTLLYRARQQHRELSTRLSTQRYWVDTTRLPLTENSLRNLYRILQTQHSRSGTRLSRLAIRWFKSYLQPNVVFSTQLACGNVAKLARVIENTLSFEHSRELNQGLGPVFQGVHTDWDCLRAQLGFYGEIYAVLANTDHAQTLLANWAIHENRFFTLCRRAAKARRRIQKLNHLVKSQYYTPIQSVGYLQLARKSVSRLQIWMAVLRYTSHNGNLTPSQLLHKIPISTNKEISITI